MLVQISTVSHLLGALQAGGLIAIGFAHRSGACTAQTGTTMEQVAVTALIGPTDKLRLLPPVALQSAARCTMGAAVTLNGLGRRLSFSMAPAVDIRP